MAALTAAEMEEQFLILYDKITNFDAPGYESDEINVFLNKAQERLVLHIINPAGNRYLTGFEVTEKRKKDLNELHRNANLIVSVTNADNKPNGSFWDLPADFLYAINEEVSISSTDPCYDGTRPEVRPIKHNDYNKIIKNPFKKPYGELVLRLDWSRVTPGSANVKRHELITDAATTIDVYHLRYLRRPQDIDIVAGVDCELDGIMHQRIVDEAVAIATGITNPEQYQIKLREAQASE